MLIPVRFATQRIGFPLGLSCFILFFGCGGNVDESHDPVHEQEGQGSGTASSQEDWEVAVSEETGHDHEGHSHHHEPPHGGTLIALGDHFAHLEIIHDATEGKITVYILDGEAENPVRVAQESLMLQIKQIEGAVAEGDPGGYSEGFKQLPLEAVANPLTGETVGDTSEFSGAAPFLIGPITGFDATILQIKLLGSAMDNIEIRYPEGNEE